MSEGFYPLKVSKAVKETSDATTFYFEVPSELESVFNYRAGQYLTFEVNIQGEKVRRSYSLCTYSGVDSQPGVTVKQVEGGKMSTYLNQNISEGDTLLVMPPMGKFVVDLNSTNSKHYVLFGGGSGITPVMGIAKAVLNQEPNSKVTLVYANKNPDSVIFKDSLAKLESGNSGRFKVLHSYDTAPFTWFGLKGILTEEKIESIVKNKIGGSFDQYEYFICGPSPMMDVIKRGLTTIGVNKEKINIEYFSAPVNSEKTAEPVMADASFNGVSEITIHVYGKTHVIQCDENTTVLNAAMKQGIDPPYSCTVGVCTTCRARVHSGSVQMLEREGLSDSEIKDGFVLTCQSVPRTNKIELTYE